MTRNAQEAVDLMRGSVTRSMARKKDKGMVALFEKNFQHLVWNALEGEDEDQRGTKTLLIFMVQKWKPKEANMEDLGGSNNKWKLSNKGHGKVLDIFTKGGQTLPPTVGRDLPAAVGLG